MKTQKVKVEQLKSNPKNPRIIKDEKFKKLVKSIKDFPKMLEIRPIVVDSDMIVLGGNMRLKACIQAGLKEVPVICADDLTEDEKKEFVIKDNLGFGEWNWDDLANDWDALKLEEWGMDLPEESFEKVEGLTDEDAVPEVPKEPITVLGDVWQLGNHRLMCGDSTSIDSVDKLMAGQKADMVFTDPPYNQNTQRGGGKIGKTLREQSDKIEFICDFNPAEFLNVCPTIFSIGMNAYIFCNKDLLPDYLNWGKNNGYSFWVLVWKKESGIPINSAHRPDIEYLLVFRKKSIFNSGLDGVNYSRLLEVKRVKEGLHPTMKPVELIENQIKIGSNSDSIVADLFGGSGSTLIACEKIGRQARLMEIDPKYCDVIIKRWQDFTGKKAVLL